MMVTGIA